MIKHIEIQAPLPILKIETPDISCIKTGCAWKAKNDAEYRVAEVVRRPSPKSFDSDENFKP